MKRIKNLNNETILIFLNIFWNFCMKLFLRKKIKNLYDDYLFIYIFFSFFFVRRIKKVSYIIYKNLVFQ